jgi:hypothetical protein
MQSCQVLTSSCGLFRAQDNTAEVQGSSRLECAKHAAHIELWNQRQARQMYYLSGVVHRMGQYKEYLRWLHLQSRLFLKLTYTEEHIAQLPNSDDDNEIIDEYDEIIRQGTQQPESGPLQNYMVCIFPYFHSLFFLKVKFLILTNVAHATKLGQIANETDDALSHPPNFTVAHNTLCAFAEVIIAFNFPTSS